MLNHMDVAASEEDGYQLVKSEAFGNTDVALNWVQSFPDHEREYVLWCVSRLVRDDHLSTAKAIETVESWYR